MTYEEHHGLVVRGKDKKLHQVRCVKKNARGGEDPANCKKTKDGRIMLKWGPVDRRLRKYAGVASKPAEFYTPFGRFTYDQLLKMPMDKVLQLLIVLELVDKEAKGGLMTSQSAFEQQYLNKGVLPPGANPADFTRDATGKLVRVTFQKDKKSRLSRK